MTRIKIRMEQNDGGINGLNWKNYK